MGSSDLLSISSPRRLFLVPLCWWSDANIGIYGDGRGGELKGVLYRVAARLSNENVGEEDDIVLKVEQEIVLQMTNADEPGNGQEEGVYARTTTSDLLDLALISLRLLLKASKWHKDKKDVGGYLAAPDIEQHFFSFKIRLLCKENSLFIRINQKDNEIRAFDQARTIFCAKSGLLQISDFSGQINHLFDDSDQSDEEMHLEFQVSGLVEARENKRQKLMVDDLKIEAPTLSGLTGLHNLGNSCFMNSALQCLVHTMGLVDFFFGDYEGDLNVENPLGMKGKLASAFGELLGELWAPGAEPVAPKIFKSEIATFVPRFGGYNQHDSQEFLAFLLDGLHEDLNRVKHKPYIEVKDGDGRPDEEVADEHWRNHLVRNNSIIVDLCQGQYRSALVCPDCQKLSIKFDPFMYLSLPLPSTMRKMTVTIFSTDGITLPFPVTINVPTRGTFEDLVQALSVDCSLQNDETLVVVEVYDHRIIRYLEEPSDKIELIRDGDRLVAYRLKESEGSPLVAFSHHHDETLFAHVEDVNVQKGTCNIKYVTRFEEKFGIPLVSRVSKFSKGSEIRKEFLKLLKPFLPNDKQNDVNGDAKMESIVDGDAKTEPILVGDAKMEPILDGDAEAETILDGDAEVEQILVGDAKMEPLLDGDAKAEKILDGDAELEPVLDGDAKMEPILDGDAKMEPLLDGDAKAETILDGDAEVEQILVGDAKMEQVLDGDAKMETILDGDAEVEPLLDGDAKAVKILDGDAELEPVLDGDAKMEPLLDGDAKVETILDGDAEVGEILDGDAKMEPVLDGDAKMEVLDVDANSELDGNSAVGSDFRFYHDEYNLSYDKIEMDKPIPGALLTSDITLSVLVTWPEKMLKDCDTSLLSDLPIVCKPTEPHEPLSLYKCLDAFLKEEPLGPEDMWYCPSCKTHRQASKKLQLWRLPEILVIHLKRFSHRGNSNKKLNDYVEFPLEDFDLSNYMVHDNSQVSHHYMLYAVSNHLGVMGGGHYTAYVRPDGGNKWYKFDDRNVSHISEEKIQTSSAYVLFYKRITDTVHNIVQ